MIFGKCDKCRRSFSMRWPGQKTHTCPYCFKVNYTIPAHNRHKTAVKEWKEKSAQETNLPAWAKPTIQGTEGDK